MPMSLQQFAKRKIVNQRNPKESVLLEDLWSDKPCALFFLRRLGCPICRAYIQIIETIRVEYEKRGLRLVCLSFESFGEGSDFDRSFTKYSFWNGPIYTIEKIVYEELFGRKGMLDNFFGLLDIDKEAYERSKSTPGNLKGDGFQLGGQYVVDKGGKILLEHKQKLFGDDAKIQDLLNVFDKCLKPIQHKAHHRKESSSPESVEESEGKVVVFESR
jgi:prostamide/prostaglandin F2alpha synthase